MTSVACGTGTADAPWLLTTPSQSSDVTARRDEASDPARLSVQAGKTQLG